MSCKRAWLLWCWLYHILAALETRPGNTQLLRLVDQRSACQSKFGGCALRTTNYPADCSQRLQNQSPFGVAQRGCTRRGMGALLSFCGGARIGERPLGLND